VNIENQASGGGPILRSAGDDSNIDLNLESKGTGLIHMSDLVRFTVGADVASATSLPLVKDGTFVDVTGTTTVTSLASTGIGSMIVVQFDAALILTHHSTDLILPGAANITTAAGDVAVFYEYASGDYRCISYQVAASAPGGGGAWTVIEEQTASASANLNFDLDNTTYKNFRFWGANLLPATDAVSLEMTYSVDGGSAWLSGGYYWGAQGLVVGVAADTHGENNADTFILTGRSAATWGNAATEGGNFVINIIRPVNTDNVGWTGNGMFLSASTQASHWVGAGHNVTGGNDIDNIKFAFSSGNIASGKILLEGQAI